MGGLAESQSAEGRGNINAEDREDVEILFMRIFARLSLLMMMVFLPVMAYTPTGLYQDGLFQFISDGFQKHTVAASVLYSMASFCVSICRFERVRRHIQHKLVKMFALSLMVTSQLSGLLVTRNDAIPGYHAAFVLVFFISNISFQILLVNCLAKRGGASRTGFIKRNVVFLVIMLFCIVYLMYYIVIRYHGGELDRSKIVSDMRIVGGVFQLCSVELLLGHEAVRLV